MYNLSYLQVASALPLRCLHEREREEKKRYLLRIIKQIEIFIGDWYVCMSTSARAHTHTERHTQTDTHTHTERERERERERET